jgi:hypothetical protein
MNDEGLTCIQTGIIYSALASKSSDNKSKAAVGHVEEEKRIAAD